MITGKTPLVRFFGIMLVTVAVFGCKKPEDDETRIRNLVDQAKALAEQQDINGLMEITTEDLRALPEGQDRQTIKLTLLMALRQYGKMSIHYPRPRVDLDEMKIEARAEVSFIVVREGHEAPDMSGLVQDPQSWLSQASKVADPYLLKLWFVKRKGDWLVRKVQLSGFRQLGDI